MSATEITLFTLIGILFLLVGLVGGVIIKSYLDQIVSIKMGETHPEMFDENGKIIADEIVALKIEPGFYDEFEEEYGSLFEEDDED